VYVCVSVHPCVRMRMYVCVCVCVCMCIGRRNILSPHWNFQDMGIGGLDDEFANIFRRAFASRIYPADLLKRMGIGHVKG